MHFFEVFQIAYTRIINRPLLHTHTHTRTHACMFIKHTPTINRLLGQDVVVFPVGVRRSARLLYNGYFRIPAYLDQLL